MSIMRGMNSKSVDLIYLDPPFNSKANYAAPIGSQAAGAAFKDTWTLRDVDVEWINLIETKHPTLYRVLLVAMTNSDKSYLAYMAARILEMHRILKETGSLYLHCDHVMVHYLKLVMDAIFGKRNFREMIVWRRNESGAKGSQYQPVSWGANADFLLFYAKSRLTVINPVIKSCLSESEIAQQFPKVDEHRQRYNTKKTAWRSPSMGPRPNLCYSFHGILPPYPSGWRLSQVRMQEEYEKGNIVIKNGTLERRSYYKDYIGVSPGNIWTEKTLLLGAQAKERTGYPTQKPIALLQRILTASSNQGDVVLDPFCGCATTLVVADRLHRVWVGIDLSDKAADLVIRRIKADQGLFRDICHRTDYPKRTDLGTLPRYNCEANKKALYGEQGGHCAGCQTHFESRHLEVDHIIGRKNGGQDNKENLQLLCGNCNRIKGNRGMDYLQAKLQL